MNDKAKHDFPKAQEENNLIIIEEKINSSFKEFQDTKKKLCLLLAKIKINKLYNQIDFQCFKEYVTSKRLKISYNTALEYAKIGELFLKYENQLAKVDFTEEDGFKKLLFLEQALSRHEEDEVFKRIKDDSFKAFSEFSKPARAGFTPDRIKKRKENEDPGQQPADTGAGSWIFEENGKLYMDNKITGSELLTFNKRFLNEAEPELAKEYKAFMANIIIAAMDHFKNIRKKKGMYK